MKPSCFQKLTSALKSAASVSIPRSRLSPPPPTQGTLAKTFERSPFLTETEHLNSQIAALKQEIEVRRKQNDKMLNLQ